MRSCSGIEAKDAGNLDAAYLRSLFSI